jgi:predicted hydrocarbon binding protein
MKVKVETKEVMDILEMYKVNMRIKPETGELVFGELPIILARAEIMANFLIELESLVGQSASSVLKRIGKTYGQKFYSLMKVGYSTMFLDDKEKIYKFFCAETQAIGWGGIVVEEVGEEIIITSPLGLASSRTFRHNSQKRETPVDAYFLGYFEGFLTEMHGKKFFGDEVECIAKGNKQCKFVFKSEPWG